MRNLRALCVMHWEAVLTAALFLTCTYGAVGLIRAGQLGWAGMALFLAYGFFQALMAFLDAADLRSRMRRRQGAADGFDS